MTQNDHRELDALRSRVSELEASARPLRRGGGCGMAVLVVVGGFVALAAIGALSHGSSDPKPAEPKVSATCDEAWARGAYEVAQARGVVRGAEVRRFDGVVVLVRASRWRSLSLDQQRTLAAAVDCAIAGNGKHLTLMRFRIDQSGADLWKLEGSDLLALREMGYGRPSEPANRSQN